jgi:hypothetical protein
MSKNYMRCDPAGAPARINKSLIWSQLDPDLRIGAEVASDRMERCRSHWGKITLKEKTGMVHGGRELVYEEQLSEDEKAIDHGGLSSSKGTLNGIAGSATRPAGDRPGFPGHVMKDSGAGSEKDSSVGSERESEERARQNESPNEGGKSRRRRVQGQSRSDRFK